MRNTIQTILSKKDNEPVVMVTAYDATMAALVDGAVDIILIGDSLGMVVQGHSSTLPVTLDEIIYHSKMVERGSKQAFLIADLPFLSYQTSVKDAVYSAGRCVKEAGVQAVKLEGGFPVLDKVKAISEMGIPIIGHLGLTPQSIHKLGNYKKKAKTVDEGKKLLEESHALEEAGASMIVLENIPHELAKEVRNSLHIITIGIGAGKDCDGQVQVINDLIGLNIDFKPHHAKRYKEIGKEIQEVAELYANDVRNNKLISK